MKHTFTKHLYYVVIATLLLSLGTAQSAAQPWTQQHSIVSQMLGQTGRVGIRVGTTELFEELSLQAITAEGTKVGQLAEMVLNGTSKEAKFKLPNRSEEFIITLDGLFRWAGANTSAAQHNSQSQFDTRVQYLGELSSSAQGAAAVHVLNPYAMPHDTQGFMQSGYLCGPMPGTHFQPPHSMMHYGGGTLSAAYPHAMQIPPNPLLLGNGSYMPPRGPVARTFAGQQRTSTRGRWRNEFGRSLSAKHMPPAGQSQPAVVQNQTQLTQTEIQALIQQAAEKAAAEAAAQTIKTMEAEFERRLAFASQQPLARPSTPSSTTTQQTAATPANPSSPVIATPPTTPQGTSGQEAAAEKAKLEQQQAAETKRRQEEEERARIAAEKAEQARLEKARQQAEEAKQREEEAKQREEEAEKKRKRAAAKKERLIKKREAQEEKNRQEKLAAALKVLTKLSDPKNRKHPTEEELQSLRFLRDSANATHEQKEAVKAILFNAAAPTADTAVKNPAAQALERIDFKRMLPKAEDVCDVCSQKTCTCSADSAALSAEIAQQKQSSEPEPAPLAAQQKNRKKGVIKLGGSRSDQQIKQEIAMATQAVLNILNQGKQPTLPQLQAARGTDNPTVAALLLRTEWTSTHNTRKLNPLEVKKLENIVNDTTKPDEVRSEAQRILMGCGVTPVALKYAKKGHEKGDPLFTLRLALLLQDPNNKRCYNKEEAIGLLTQLLKTENLNPRIKKTAEETLAKLTPKPKPKTSLSEALDSIQRIDPSTLLSRARDLLGKVNSLIENQNHNAANAILSSPETDALMQDLHYLKKITQDPYLFEILANIFIASIICSEKRPASSDNNELNNLRIGLASLAKDLVRHGKYDSLAYLIPKCFKGYTLFDLLVEGLAKRYFSNHQHEQRAAEQIVTMCSEKPHLDPLGTHIAEAIAIITSAPLDREMAKRLKEIVNRENDKYFCRQSVFPLHLALASTILDEETIEKAFECFEGNLLGALRWGKNNLKDATLTNWGRNVLKSIRDTLEHNPSITDLVQIHYILKELGNSDLKPLLDEALNNLICHGLPYSKPFRDFLRHTFPQRFTEEETRFDQAIEEGTMDLFLASYPHSEHGLLYKAIKDLDNKRDDAVKEIVSIITATQNPWIKEHACNTLWNFCLKILNSESEKTAKDHAVEILKAILTHTNLSATIKAELIAHGYQTEKESINAIIQDQFRNPSDPLCLFKMAKAETNLERKIGLLMHALEHATPLSSLGTEIAQVLYSVIREHNPTSAPYFLEALIQRFPHSVACYFKQPSDPDAKTLKVIAQFLQNPFIPPSLRESPKKQVMENLEELLKKIFQQPYSNVKDIAPWLLLIMQQLSITEDQTVQKRCDCLRTIQHPQNPEAIQTCIRKLTNGDYLKAINIAQALLEQNLSPEKRDDIIKSNNDKLPSLALLNAAVADCPSEITEEIVQTIRKICDFFKISNSDLYSDPLLILLFNTLVSDKFHSQRPATNLTLQEFKEASQEPNPLRFACARAKLFEEMRDIARTAIHGRLSDFETQKDKLTQYLKEAQKQVESTTDPKRRELLTEWITTLDLFIKDITHSSVHKIPEGTPEELALLHAPENLNSCMQSLVSMQEEGTSWFIVWNNALQEIGKTWGTEGAEDCMKWLCGFYLRNAPNTKEKDSTSLLIEYLIAALKKKKLPCTLVAEMAKLLTWHGLTDENQEKLAELASLLVTYWEEMPKGKDKEAVAQIIELLVPETKVLQQEALQAVPVFAISENALKIIRSFKEKKTPLDKTLQILLNELNVDPIFFNNLFLEAINRQNIQPNDILTVIQSICTNKEQIKILYQVLLAILKENTTIECDPRLPEQLEELIQQLQ